eukprot:9497091-Pyramimonas_sp.AAC.1
MVKPEEEVWLEMTSMKATNARVSLGESRGAGQGPMLPETRTLLDEFYSPYNAKLASILGDPKWNWHRS